VDLARAETRVSIDHQNLIEANLTAYEARHPTETRHWVGLDGRSDLAEPAKRNGRFGTGGTSGASLQGGRRRVELRITKGQVIAETYGLRAAKAGFLPTISAFGDYGFSGSTPKSTARTGSIGGRLDLPILSGGSTTGEIAEPAAAGRPRKTGMTTSSSRWKEDVVWRYTGLGPEGWTSTATPRQRKEIGPDRELTLAQRRYLKRRVGRQYPGGQCAGLAGRTRFKPGRMRGARYRDAQVIWLWR